MSNKSAQKETSQHLGQWSAQDLMFVPLGGSGEIGMNANLFHYQDQWLMVDLGISFPDETMPGIDVVLPDYNKASMQVKIICCNNKFETLMDDISDEMDIKMEYAAPREH